MRTQVERIQGVFESLEEELYAAMTKHAPQNSHHESYAVILEELNEYWHEVKKWPKRHDPQAMRKELLHIAAMAVRAILDHKLADVAVNRVQPQTVAFYARHLSYAISEIGNIAIGDLNGQHVQIALNSLGVNLSPRSVAHVRSVLRNALNTAIKWGLTTYNAAERADAPRVVELPDRTLSPESVIALLDAIEGHRLETLFWFDVFLGLRPKELINLHWRDVDRDAGVITIRNSKTASGNRIMPLGETLANSLRNHWREQQEERLTLGVHWQEYGLVFPSERGTPLGHRNLIRTFKAICKRAGLPTDVQLYDLRRTAISWFGEFTDPRTLQTLAGHSTPTVALRIYAKSRQDTQRQAIDEAVRRRTGT